MAETKNDKKHAIAGRVDPLVRPPRSRISAERRAERIAELEAEKRWHFAEIESAEATILHHCSNVRDIENQIDALNKKAV